MMDQTVYMSGYSSGPYRPPVSVAPPQGSKLATYMNRGGPQQPHNFQDVNNKMTNLSLMNRPPGPGRCNLVPTWRNSDLNVYRHQLSRSGPGLTLRYILLLQQILGVWILSKTIITI